MKVRFDWQMRISFVENGPSTTLTEDEAKALYETLHARYGGGERKHEPKPKRTYVRHDMPYTTWQERLLYLWEQNKHRTPGVALARMSAALHASPYDELRGSTSARLRELLFQVGVVVPPSMSKRQALAKARDVKRARRAA